MNIDLVKLGKEYSLDTEDYSVDFDYVDTEITPPDSKTVQKKIVYFVNVKNKASGEMVKGSIDFLNVPIKGDLGYKIDGTYYESIKKDKRSPGWYITTSDKKLILEFIPQSGRRLKVVQRYGELRISLSSGSDATVNLGAFLKALTGKSYRELALLLGIKNRYVLTTLIKEPSRDECIDSCMKLLTNSPEAYPGSYKFKELKRRLYSRQYLNYGNIKEKVEYNMSFLCRAKGKTLAQDVLDYKKGIILTTEILNKIDESNVDTLIVFDSKGRVHELKKYKLNEDDEGLCEKELISMFNTYACCLDGLEYYDSRYELNNRLIKNYEDTIKEYLIDSFQAINSEVSNYLITQGLSNARLEQFKLPNIDTMRLIDDFKKSGESKLAQTSETTNLLSIETKKSKVATDYNGRSNEEMISVKSSEFSIYDAFHQPESKKVGYTHHLTLTAKRGEDGIYRGKYVRVKDGIVDNEDIVYLDSLQITSSYIAPWDADMSKDSIQCYHGNRLVDVDRKNVQYKEFSPLNTMSLPTATIPFMNFNNGKRIVMGGNQAKQAVITMKKERAIVSTGVCGIEDVGITRVSDVLSRYYGEHSIRNYDYEEFLTFKLHLVSASYSQGYRNLFFDIYDNNETYVGPYQYFIPCCQKSTDNTLVQYNINPINDYWYQGDDIVVYNDSLDIKDYDLQLFEDLGSQKVDKKLYNSDLAIGNNYLMAWKTYDSTTLDDGCTINEGLLGTGKLAHVAIYQEVVKLSRDEDYYESFELHDNRAGDRFENNGLPKVGTYLSPRSIVCYRYRYKKGREDEPINCSVRLDNVTEGVVFSATLVGDDEARILIGNVFDAELGDKVAGNYGNKCVIANIVPESEMPHTADGHVIDFLFNPLGIPSRMNIGQLMEAVLGLVGYLKNERFIITPNNRHSKEIVDKAIEDYNIHPMTLIDGRTGIPFDRKVNVGCLYIKKLKHFATSKSNETGINSSFNPTTLQGLKGKRVGGGQTIGEMELWALSASGVNRFIQELFSYQSDDIQAKKMIGIRGSRKIDATLSNNHNDDVVLAELRLFGVNIINNEKTGQYEFTILTDEDIQGLADRPMVNDAKYLQDNATFGSSRRPEDAVKSRQTWSYLDLKCEIINPLWIYKSQLPYFILATEIVADEDSPLKGAYKYKTERALNCEIVQNIIYGGIDKRLQSHPYKVAFKNNKIYYTALDNVPDYEWCDGISAVVKMFKVTNLEDTRRYYEKSLDNKRFVTQEDSFNHESILDKIDTFIEKGIDLSKFIISHYPVIPRPFRVETLGRTPDFDVYYKHIINAIDNAKNVKAFSSGVFKEITAFLGLDSKFKTGKDQAHDVLYFFNGHDSDKHDGFFRDQVSSKVVDLSFRGVIVPAEAGLIKPYEIGVPFKKAVTCLWCFIKPMLLNGVLKDYKACIEGNDVDKELFKVICNKDAEGLADLIKECGEDLEIFNPGTLMQKVVDEICRYCKTVPLIVGRQPTLHEFGIRGFYPVLVDGIAIRIHQLLCTGYNADFDGDQMYGVFSMSEESGEEIIDKLSPLHSYMNGKDDSFVLEPTQDTLLGCYLATMLYDNEESIVGDERYLSSEVCFYKDLDLLKYDVDERNIGYSKLVCYTNEEGNKYLSTAGRILFNSLFSGGFTEDEFTNPLGIEGIDTSNYKNLRFDGLIKKKKDKNKKGGLVTYSIKEVCKYIYSNFKGIEICDSMDRIFCFGTKCADTSGITLSLDDFIQHPKMNEYVEKAKKISSKINEYYKLGLISPEDRKSSTAKIYNYATEKVRNTLFDYFPRNNNLFIIIDSGARGNLGQLSQSCGLIGTVSKTSAEMLETPILSNYTNGLSSAEQNYLAYSTRIGVSAVQNDTAEAGALTRREVFSISGLTIVESDCGKSDTDLEVAYSDDIFNITFNGEKSNLEDLLGKSISNDDPNLFYYKALGSETFNSDVLYYIKKHRIREILLEDGKATFKYKLSNTFRNLLSHRCGKDLPYLDNGIVTDKTVDYIEQENLPYVNVRTMLTCNSVGGVCAKCYGVVADTKKFPKIGTRIGIKAAQAMGEPATQLNMERFNKIGMSSGGRVSAVSVFKCYASGSIPGKKEGLVATISQSDGYAKVSSCGKNSSIITIGSKSYKTDKDRVLVKNNEFVKNGQQIIDGFVDVNQINLQDSKKQLMTRQMTLLDIFYNIFAKSSIDVNARNFECLVRSQLSLGRVLYSDNPDIKSGRTYFIQELERAKSDGSNIDYYSVVENTDKVINKYSGALTNLLYSSFAENLATVSISPDKNNLVNNSILGKILIGENLVNNRCKALPKIDRSLVVKQEEKVEEENEFSSKISEEKISKASEALASLNLNTLDFSDDFGDLDDEVSNDFEDNNDVVDVENIDEVEKEDEVEDVDLDVDLTDDSSVMHSSAFDRK